MILEYLEVLKGANCGYSTITTHVSALSQCLPLTEGTTIGNHHLITAWLRGYKHQRPPRRRLAPPWDLAIVLAALREAPYEPLEKAPLRELTFKAIFLLAITSVRRVSELQALCAVPPYTTVNPRSIILRVNPPFCPKTSTEVALRGTVELKQFPWSIRTDFDEELHKNCPVRALSLYLKRTKPFRLNDQLMVGYGENRHGKAVSKRTLARWISTVIRDAYTRLGRDPPDHANPHTTRGVAASWAELAKVDLLTICEAATWSDALTFARHYRLDFAGRDVGGEVLRLAQPRGGN